MNTPIQLRSVLRSLRQSSSLTQAQLGERLGVNQKRIARIERTPGVTSFDQISRLVSAMGGRVVIQLTHAAGDPAAPQPAPGKPSSTPDRAQADW